jgi:hypothetical protein
VFLPSLHVTGFLPASLHSSGRHLPTAPIEANA